MQLHFYHFSLFWVQHVFHLLKSKNSVLDAQEERTLPADGSSNWRLILEDWWVISIGFEQCVHGIHLTTNQTQSLKLKTLLQSRLFTNVCLILSQDSIICLGNNIIWNLYYNFMYLFSKLDQDVVKLFHHLWVDSFSRSDMPEVQKHIKGSLSRSQFLEWVINEVPGLIFNGCYLLVKPVHDSAPACYMSQTEDIKSNLKIIKNDIFHVAPIPNCSP